MTSTGKRQRDSEYGNRNGRNKRRSYPGGDREQQPMPTPDDTTYRILCPVVKIGSIIGKGGSIIKSLRHETHARIKVTDSLPGVDERVVLIWSSPKDLLKAGRESKKSDAEEDEGFDDKDEPKDEGDGASEETESEFLCPAQEALFKVHARIIEGDGIPLEDEDKDASQQVTARLLVPNNQIGCLLGKGGKIIEKMRTETSAQIRILPKDQLPGCALPSDELVQISGDPTVVRKAMHEISARIHENPPRDRPQGAAHLFPPAPPLLPPGPALLHRGPDLFSSGNVLPPGNPGFGSVNMSGPVFGMAPPLSNFGGYGGIDAGRPWPSASPTLPVLPPLGTSHAESKESASEQEYSIRLLCPDDKIGFVIGKGGNAIRQLREATRARIKVEDSVSGSDERVIVISAHEYPDDTISPVIEAALQLQCRACDISSEKEGLITTRLLVPSKNIGCLLGRGGDVITEMRKKTTASIKVLKKTDIPKCALESDELVQVIGDERIARDALIEILARLRNNAFKDQVGVQSKFGVGSFPSLPRFPLQPSFPLQGGNHGAPSEFLGRHEFGSPGRRYSLNGFGMQGGSTFPTSGGTFPTSHGDLGPLQAATSTYGTSSFYGGPGGGYGNLGGSHPGRSIGGGGFSRFSDGFLKDISGATVDVTIPGAAVSAVLDEGGSNIREILQISGAKLKIHDPRGGSRDRVVEISGTPEKTEAAQSLLRAFILTAQTSVGPGVRASY